MKIKVCTFNYQNGIGITSEVESKLEKFEYAINPHIETACSTYSYLYKNSFDVLGLQEVEGRSGRQGFWTRKNQIDYFKGKVGYKFGVFEITKPEPSWFPYWIRQGIGMLSMLPIIGETFVHDLPRVKGEQRKLLESVLEKGGKKFKVFVTHLEYEEKEDREKQIVYLKDNILSKENMPAIILGDFNLIRNTDYEVFKVNGWKALVPESPSAEYWEKCVGESGAQFNDAILVSRHWNVLDSARVDKVRLSDHLPVRALLELPESFTLN